MDDPLEKEALRLAADVDWIRKLARRLVRDQHLAEDIAQDALLVDLRRSFDPRLGWKPWIRGVVRNLAHSAIRKRRRQATGELPEGAGASNGGAIDTCLLVERQRLLAGCVLELKEPYRQAVLLRFYEGLPQRAIARRLQIPVSTVNTRLRRAVEHLRRKLDAEFGGERQRWLAALAPLTLKPAATHSLLGLGAMAMTNKILVALVVLGVCVGGVVFYDGTRQAPRHTIPRPRDARVASSFVAASPVVIKTVPFVPERDPNREASVGRTLAVQVVMDATGAPVPGAELFVFPDRQARQDPSTQKKMAETMARVRTRYRLFQELGKRYVADVRGVARLRVKQGASLMAMADDADAVARVDSKLRDLTLRLRPRRELELRVVDERRHPLAGIPVGITMMEQGREYLLAYARTSGPSGSARLSVSDATMLGKPLQEGGVMHVGLRFPLNHPVDLELDSRDWPRAPLTLVCPPVGSVSVEVRGTGGSPVRNGCLVELEAATPGRGLRGMDPDRLAGTTRKGRVLLAPLGLGLVLSLRAVPHVGQQGKHLGGLGPSFPGQCKRLEISVAGRNLRLHGSLTHPDGSPLVRQRIAITLEEADSARYRGSFTVTKEDGSFSISWFEYEGEPMTGRLTVRPARVAKPGDRRALVTLEGVSSPPGDDWDLGHLVIDREEPLTAGRVVRPDGSPLAGVTVSIAYKQERPEQEPRFIQGEAARPTGKDGRFKLWARLEDGDPYLTVTCPGPWHHDPVPLDAGRTDVQLVLVPWGELAGRVLLDAGVPYRRLMVAVWPLSNSAQRHWGSMGWRQAASWDGKRFRFDGLAPGVYDLGVGAGISEGSAVYVEGIHVPGGVAARDARLEPLDLRGKFWAFDVLAVDAQDRPVPASLYALRRGREGMEQLGSSRKSQIIATQRQLKAILVQAAGYFPAILEPFQGTRKVVLKRGLPVVLIWPGHIGLSEHEGIRLHVRLEREVPDMSGLRDSRAARFGRALSPLAGFCQGGGTRLQLAVPAAGAYRVVVELQWREGGMVATEPLTLSAGGSLMVAPDPPALEHRLSWSQSELSRGLQVLRQHIRR